MTTDRVIQSGVEETTSSVGPGTLDLDGAALGWNRFRTFFDDNDVLVYVRRSANGTKQQLISGVLKYGTGAGGRDQLTVVTVLKSTDGGVTPTAIDWIANDNPCAVFPASAEDLLDSALRTHFGASAPSWLKRGLRVAAGVGAAARKLNWRFPSSDVEIGNIDETNNRFLLRKYKGADIASASTADLGAATGDWVDVTGTTPITALGTANQGEERVVRFTGALTLTHNGTSLILPGAANIKTAAGDFATFRSLGFGNWICISYVRASGTMPRPLLATLTASGSAALDFTAFNTTLYSGYEFVIESISPANDGAALFAQYSTDGGSSFLSTGSYSSSTSGLVAAYTGSSTNTGTAIAITAAIGSAAGRAASGAVFLVSGGAAARATSQTGLVRYVDNGGNHILAVCSGSNVTTSQVNAIRFLMDSGNIASGVIRVYGIPK